MMGIQEGRQHGRPHNRLQLCKDECGKLRRQQAELELDLAVNVSTYPSAWLGGDSHRAVEQMGN